MSHVVVKSSAFLFALKRFSSISNGVNLSFNTDHLQVMAYSDLESVYVKTMIPYIFKQGSIGSNSKSLKICIYPGYLVNQLNDKGVLAISVNSVNDKCELHIQHDNCVINQYGLFAEYDDSFYQKVLPSDTVFTINFYKLVNFSHRLNDTVTLECTKQDNPNLSVSTEERSLIIPFILKYNMNPFCCKIKSKDIALMKTLFDCHNCFICVKQNNIIFFNDTMFAVIDKAKNHDD